LPLTSKYPKFYAFLTFLYLPALSNIFQIYGLFFLGKLFFNFFITQLFWFGCFVASFQTFINIQYILYFSPDRADILWAMGGCGIAHR
jgi:hypothetical protein